MECGFECNLMIHCNLLRYVDGVCQLGIKRKFKLPSLEIKASFLVVIEAFLKIEKVIIHSKIKVHFVAEDEVAQRMELMTLKYIGMVHFL